MMDMIFRKAKIIDTMPPFGYSPIEWIVPIVTPLTMFEYSVCEICLLVGVCIIFRKHRKLIISDRLVQKLNSEIDCMKNKEKKLNGEIDSMHLKMQTLKVEKQSLHHRSEMLWKDLKDAKQAIKEKSFEIVRMKKTVRESVRVGKKKDERLFVLQKRISVLEKSDKEMAKVVMSKAKECERWKLEKLIAEDAMKRRIDATENMALEVQQLKNEKREFKKRMSELSAEFAYHRENHESRTQEVEEVHAKMKCANQTLEMENMELRDLIALKDDRYKRMKNKYQDQMNVIGENLEESREHERDLEKALDKVNEMQRVPKPKKKKHNKRFFLHTM